MFPLNILDAPLNTTLLHQISPTSLQPPFYYTTRPSIFPFISDKYASLLLPVVAYWLLSLVFLYIDFAKYPYFEKRRIHESPEVLARNKATIGEVVRAVFVQHSLQTLIGTVWLEPDPPPMSSAQHLAAMAKLAPRVANFAFLALGRKSAEQILYSHGAAVVRFAYWWGIPTIQSLVYLVALDTWQYCVHRLFHVSRWLYRNIHSVHHRLYVPYAFGALYNHPFEGIVFDSFGGAFAHEVARLSGRQDILLFTLATMKTVDDHSGYKLWWDPFQAFFYNNADYHDIHHQAYGIKANFSQPFFIQWDIILGTRMTRAQAASKTRRVEKIE